MSQLEITANALNAVSILLAGRASIHTWWTGLLGCAAFGVLFFHAQLYADVTLQLFFIATSIAGWRQWRRVSANHERPVQRTHAKHLGLLWLVGILVATLYGWMLHRFTDAYAPFLDSVILSFSVLGQVLLIHRRIETWWCWLLVNTIAVPLFYARGLHITALLYTGFWVNAVVSYHHWKQRLLIPTVIVHP